MKLLFILKIYNAFIQSQINFLNVCATSGMRVSKTYSDISSDFIISFIVKTTLRYSQVVELMI